MRGGDLAVERMDGLAQWHTVMDGFRSAGICTGSLQMLFILHRCWMCFIIVRILQIIVQMMQHAGTV